MEHDRIIKIQFKSSSVKVVRELLCLLLSVKCNVTLPIRDKVLTLFFQPQQHSYPSVFIYGHRGSGKSHVMQVLLKELEVRCCQDSQLIPVFLCWCSGQGTKNRTNIKTCFLNHFLCSCLTPQSAVSNASLLRCCLNKCCCPSLAVMPPRCSPAVPPCLTLYASTDSSAPSLLPSRRDTS